MSSRTPDGRGARRMAALVLALLAACAEPGVPDPPATRVEGWPEQLSELVDSARERFGVPSVDATSVPGALPPGAVLVDVRTADEIAVSRVSGARPLTDDAARAAFLAAQPEQPVYVVCTAGWRSAEFTSYLIQGGIEAYNVEGGLCALAAAGAELVDAAGEPTRRIHAFSQDFIGCVPDGYEAVAP